MSTFEAHYRRHTNQHPYACDYGSCGEAFHDRGALIRHHRTHADERPFPCKYEACGQAFHDSEALDEHCHTHENQSLFACRYDSCGQTFHNREGLTEHHRAHKQRPLACEYDSCSRTFARRETLEAHMHMHTRERPFTCSYEGCSKSFCDRGGLIQHESSHINKDIHHCGYLSRNESFNKTSQLHHHYREEHEATITSVDESRPIRLRLSQPKRQDPEPLEDGPRKRLLIRLHTKTTVGDSLTSDLRETPKSCTESRSVPNRASSCIQTRKLHQDASSSDSSLSTSSTPQASGKYLLSSPGTELTPLAMPSSNRPLAPALQAPVKSRSAEQTIREPHTNRESNGHGTSVYTSVCGVYSREKALPYKVETRCGIYHCPRCDTQFTRTRGVMRHFVGCITKHGNPDSLKWTDHPSLQSIVRYYARNGYRGQEEEFLHLAADAEEKSRNLPKVALLRPLTPKPLSSNAEESIRSVELVGKPSRRDALLQEDIVRPIQKRRDALRRSNYNPETIARDVLLATGSHPSMDPLNAHLDLLRQKFRAVNLESNMSTFRWDLVDPEQNPEQDFEKGSEKEPRPEHEHAPERHAEKDTEPEQSAPTASGAKKDKMKPKSNDAQRCGDMSFSLPSRSSGRPAVLDNGAPFRVILPDKMHFGPMSTIYTTVFNCDASARLMSNNEDLWAAIFTMLETRFPGPDFTVRAAVRKHPSDVIGWVAYHEVDTLQAKPEDLSAYLDWTTVAHLMPPQISRFTSVEESAKKVAERSKQRKVGHALALTIQARATEAQMYFVPVRRLVINALVVHPLHQGRGVASALLKSITAIADVQKLPIWVQAPEDPAIARGMLKAGLFRRAGFTCAGELNLDLDSYGPGPRERDKGEGVSFGTYKWNYMLRWPQSISQKPS